MHEDYKQAFKFVFHDTKQRKSIKRFLSRSRKQKQNTALRAKPLLPRVAISTPSCIAIRLKAAGRWHCIVLSPTKKKLTGTGLDRCRPTKPSTTPRREPPILQKEGCLPEHTAHHTHIPNRTTNTANRQSGVGAGGLPPQPPRPWAGSASEFAAPTPTPSKLGNKRHQRYRHRYNVGAGGGGRAKQASCGWRRRSRRRRRHGDQPPR